MNWPRGLLRIWAIVSVLWIIGYIWYFWHSCAIQVETGEHWCLTGEFDDWIEPLRYFGWRAYLYNAGWTVGVPVVALAIGATVYVAARWVAAGFGGKKSN